MTGYGRIVIALNLNIINGGYMKIAFIVKTVALTVILSPILCSAVEVPRNSLQVEYNKNKLPTHDDGNLLSFDTVYQIPSKTYHYLDTVFTSFYNKVTFNTAIADSTFETNPYYELVSIPLIAENVQGLQLELFGNFSDPASKRLSNLSKDQALSNYYSNTEQLNIYNSELSVGAGIRFNTSKNSKIKVIISNNEMPGYGNSNALLGFETSF